MKKNAALEASLNKGGLSARSQAAWIALGAAVLALIVWLVMLLHPLPPRTLTLATGPEGSSYAMLGKRYKELLAKDGITVHLVATAGGVENLALLSRPGSGVDAGFVAAGIAKESDDSGLMSLGTLGYEPLWFFTRNVATDRGLASLKGKRVSAGPEGSDSRAILNELLSRNALDVSKFQLLPLPPEESADALLHGRIDAAFLVTSWGSPVVRQLAKADGVDLATFSRADAYVALFPSLTKRVLPAGVADLEKDRPNHDVTLLASKTCLVARAGLHPALQYLLLELVSKLHARAGIFQKAGEFPAAESLDFPLSPEARNYYKSGQPFLQRYLPFWLAALVEQLVVVLIPVLGLTYPLVKGLMSLYGWGMQRRIFTIYGELHWLESQLDRLGDKPVPPELAGRMRTLEARANRVRVSSNYIPMLYSLKETVAFVSARVERQGHAQ